MLIEVVLSLRGVIGGESGGRRSFFPEQPRL